MPLITKSWSKSSWPIETSWLPKSFAISVKKPRRWIVKRNWSGFTYGARSRVCWITVVAFPVEMTCVKTSSVTVHSPRAASTLSRFPKLPST